MDLLSEVLSMVISQNSSFGILKAGGDWALHFPEPGYVKFNVNAVIRGSCWLATSSMEEAVRLEAGDCFLVSYRDSLRIGSDLSLPAADASLLFQHSSDGVVHYGEHEDCVLIGGRFSFTEEASLLFNSLPPRAVVNSDSEQASVLRWALHQLVDELSSQSPGSTLVARYLGHIMLVQVLRLYLASESCNKPSWLLLQSDPRVTPAIQAIHAEPGRNWTVEDLASVAGVSRSTLALRFKQTVGLAPLEYASFWRMQLAAQALRDTKVAITSIAQKLGYGSDSAFSNAFKRIMGCSPKDYRNR
ncbi:TPA: AraC family transcriptional regulator [Pseudomonas aeruginosa]|nr:AraC family transcriptional regulator [Pseudomonas aeruginosa]MCT0513810.1 AraC family transcriptional regulator [Pseudomonas aeruginosa]MCT0563496.1 AraC family transcriptional regulator [Pseudomonas aeruginosa]MCT1035271.1 AraC family transcriptional regulator [Pseudomonas aeruginosa]MCT1072140.1 AraC family transcriptional regulator [Pseudomonas aeruginosa]